jgi:hypothetical protein
MSDESRKALIINYLQKRLTSIIYFELLIHGLSTNPKIVKFKNSDSNLRFGFPDILEMNHFVMPSAAKESVF